MSMLWFRATLSVCERAQSHRDYFNEGNHDAGHQEISSRGFRARIRIRKASIKSTSFHFLGIALTHLIYNGIWDALLMKCVLRLSISDAFMNALVEMLHKHPMLVRDPAECMSHTTERKVEDEAKEKDDELIDPLPSKTISLLKTFDDSSMVHGDPRHRSKKKSRKVNPHCKGRKSKKTLFSF